MGWTRQEVLDVARSTGKSVVEAWSDHDAGQMGTVVGPMLHHTGSTWSYPSLTAPTLRTVREGRSDLQNALSMYYIDYAGTIYCITEKIAWHAGGGSWAGITDGNGHYAGIEAESDGVQWTKPTVASYKRLATAILRKTGRTVAYAPLHKQYALPPGRKTDFSGLDPATFLADVNADLSGTPTSEEDDMLPEEKQQLAEVHWMLTQIKPQTDRLEDEDAQTDLLLWAIADPDQGLRTQVASLQGQVAALASAVSGISGGSGLDMAAVKAVADEAASKAATEALAGLADRLKPSA